MKRSCERRRSRHKERAIGASERCRVRGRKGGWSEGKRECRRKKATRGPARREALALALAVRRDCWTWQNSKCDCERKR